MSWTQRLRGHLRAAAQIAREQPDYLSGLRAAAATVLPLFFGELHHEFAFVWMALGGWLTTLADSGGAYRTRAAAMGALMTAGAISCAVATLIGVHPWLAAPLLFLWGCATSLVRVRGEAAAMVGTLTLITFCIALGTPASSVSVAGLRVALFVAGAACAMALSLGLWPIHPYRPAREAVANCYRALAEHLRALRGLAEKRAGEDEWLALSRTGRPRVRAALEKARAALAAVRGRRESETARGEQLLVLLEIADVSLGTLGALAEALHGRATPTPPRSATAIPTTTTTTTPASTAIPTANATPTANAIPNPIRQQPADALREVETAFAGVAAAAVGDAPYFDLANIPTEGRRRVSWVPAASAGVRGASEGNDELAALIHQLLEETRAAIEAAAILREGSGVAPRTAAPAARLEAPALRTSLRDALRPDSLVMRHALRVGATTAAGLLLGEALGFARNHWITVTIVLVLQPSSGATVRRALQRMLGTLVGAVVAAVITPVVQSPLGIALALFPLSMLAVALRPLNYGLFSALVTPVFVLMAESTAGDFHLTPVRIANTLVGGGLALAGAYLLWPSWEREQFPAQLAALLESVRDYLHRALRAPPGGAGEREVVAARRRIGLAGANAEASFQRFLGEPHAEAQVEPAMAVLAYARRLTGAITAAWAAGDDAALRARVRERADGYEQALADLAAAARDRRPPRGDGTLPLEPGGWDAVPQLERIERHLAVLHGALARFAEVSPRGS